MAMLPCEQFIVYVTLWKETAPYLKWLVAGFPPRRPGVRARVWSCGICGGQSGVGAGFL
jgi:hypothetical protein